MLDLECDDLIHEMLHIFSYVVSEAHPKNVSTSMQAIMILILDKSENILEKLVVVILSSLGTGNQYVSPASTHRLAMNVIEQCANNIEPHVILPFDGTSAYEDDI